MKPALLLIAWFALAPSAHAYTTHCQRNGGPTYACHICTRGSNWMTLTEYECSAKEEARQERDREWQACYRDFSKDPPSPFKTKCMDISRRSP